MYRITKISYDEYCASNNNIGFRQYPVFDKDTLNDWNSALFLGKMLHLFKEPSVSGDHEPSLYSYYLRARTEDDKVLYFEIKGNPPSVIIPDNSDEMYITVKDQLIKYIESAEPSNYHADFFEGNDFIITKYYNVKNNIAYISFSSTDDIW